MRGIGVRVLMLPVRCADEHRAAGAQHAPSLGHEQDRVGDVFEDVFGLDPVGGAVVPRPGGVQVVHLVDARRGDPVDIDEAGNQMQTAAEVEMKPGHLAGSNSRSTGRQYASATCRVSYWRACCTYCSRSRSVGRDLKMVA